MSEHAAARLDDPTEHGGAICEASDDVTVNGRGAARLGDEHHCPLVINGKKHVGGPIVEASGTVYVNGLGAARVGDHLACTGPEEEEKEKEEEDEGSKLGRENSKSRGEEREKKTQLTVVEKSWDKSLYEKKFKGEGALGSGSATFSVVKVEATAEAGAHLGEDEGFVGGEVRGGNTGLEGKLEGESPQLGIPWTDYGISVSGEVTGSVGSAEVKVGAGIKYDKEKGVRIFAGEKAGALLGESVKVSLVVKHRKKPPDPERPPDRISDGSPDVLIGG